jgi:hypothetical protein
MKVYLKSGMNYLERKKKKAMRCPICGCLNFFVQVTIDEWMSKAPRAFDLKNDEKRFLYGELMNRFVVDEPTCGMDTHHVSYVFDITMPVCSDCHKKIHHSDEKPWSDFKPIDKRHDPKRYEKLKSK